MAALAALLAGCGFDYWIDFDVVAGDGPSAWVDMGGIELPIGAAVAVRATPMRDGRVLENTEVALDAHRSDVLGIDRGVDGKWYFVVYGAREGTTTVDAFVGERQVAEIPFLVRPPATP